MSSISATVDAMLAKAKGNMSAVVTKSLEYQLEEIIDRSPVGDPTLWKHAPKDGVYNPGHFKRNWQVGVNSKPTTELEGEDISGKQVLTECIDVVKSSNPLTTKTYHIVNNTPYAFAVETGIHPLTPESRDTWVINGNKRPDPERPYGVLSLSLQNWDKHLHRAFKDGWK
jgi:hypothetical protein